MSVNCPQEKPFNASETGFCKMMLRTEWRRCQKKRRSLDEKFGTGVDLSRVEEKESMIRSMYRKCGGDPDNIS